MNTATWLYCFLTVLLGKGNCPLHNLYHCEVTVMLSNSAVHEGNFIKIRYLYQNPSGLTFAKFFPFVHFCITQARTYLFFPVEVYSWQATVRTSIQTLNYSPENAKMGFHLN